MKQIMDYMASPLFGAHKNQPNLLGDTKKPSRIASAALAGFLSAGVTGIGISTAEYINCDKTINGQVEQVTYAQPSKAGLLAGAINPVLGVATHYLLREPQTHTQIKGSFSGLATTTFRPAFTEHEFVESDVRTIDYVCSKKDGDWDVVLSEDLGSFNKKIKTSIADYCDELYTQN